MIVPGDDVGTDPGDGDGGEDLDENLDEDLEVMSDDELTAALATIDAGGVPGGPLRARQPAGRSAGLELLLRDANPAGGGGAVEVLGGASAELQALLAERLAEGTRTAYEADWRQFTTWTLKHHGVEGLDASGLVVAEYVAALATALPHTFQPAALSTIGRRLAAVRYGFELAGRPSPTAEPVVRAALAGARRRLAGRARQAAPLSLEAMRSIVLGLPIASRSHPAIVERDRLVIALGWAAALHPSELVGLDVGDVHVVGDPDVGDGGAVLWLKARKGEPAGAAVAVPFSSRRAACPARRYLAYLKGLPAAQRTGPLFRAIDRHGTAGDRLARRSVTPIVRRAVTTCLRGDGSDVDVDAFQANSLRAGFVTECRRRGVDDQLIARTTRHSIAGDRRGGILDVYDRPGDLLARTALDPTWW